MKTTSLLLQVFCLNFFLAVASAFLSKNPARHRRSIQLHTTIGINDFSSVQVKTLDGTSIDVKDTVIGDDCTTILSCLSHFGDFNAWELTQQYKAIQTSANIILVGIGSVESGQKFSNDLDLDQNEKITLLVDETGSLTEALGCYKGWLAIDKAHAEKWPATDVNPYIKLLGMIFGFGSPGTIPKVLYGYIGNPNGDPSSRKWVVDSLLQGSQKGRWPQLTEEAFADIPTDSGLRPFELATLRAQTGIHIVRNWGTLGPKDGDLFTRMGGSFVFRGGECVFEHFDKGILTYADVEEICKAAADPIVKTENISVGAEAQ